eukprot:g12271.t1
MGWRSRELGIETNAFMVRVAPLSVLDHPAELEALGVRAVVNLCEEYAGPKAEYACLKITQLWLPTVDHQPPKVSDLWQAVAFINAHRMMGRKVLNPGMGDLTLLLECCGAAAPLAGEIAAKVNTNQFTGTGSGPEEQIKAEYVGEDKQYQYTSMCIASDVCAVNVAGSTAGTKLLYTVVLQILNKNAGDLVYAGEGSIGSCLEGMNTVNQANMSGFKKEVPNMMDLFGTKIQLGTKKVMDVAGLQQLEPLEMLSQCKNTSSTGVLYIFKNKFWNKQQSYMNISKYQTDSYDAEMAADYKALMDYPLPGEKKEKPSQTPKKGKDQKDKKDEGDEIGEAIGGILGSIFGGDEGKVSKGKGKGAAKNKDEGDDVGEVIGDVLGAVFGGDQKSDASKKGQKGKASKEDSDGGDLGEAVGGILGEIFGDNDKAGGKAEGKASAAEEAGATKGKKDEKGAFGLLEGIGGILEQIGEESKKTKGGKKHPKDTEEAPDTEEAASSVAQVAAPPAPTVPKLPDLGSVLNTVKTEATAAVAKAKSQAEATEAETKKAEEAVTGVDEAKTKAEEAGQKVADAIAAAQAKAEADAKEAANKLAEQTKEAQAKAEADAKEAAEKMAAAAKKTAAQTKETAEKLAEQTQKAQEKAEAAAKEMADNLAKAQKQAAADAKEAAEKAAADAKAAAKKAAAAVTPVVPAVPEVSATTQATDATQKLAAQTQKTQEKAEAAAKEIADNLAKAQKQAAADAKQAAEKTAADAKAAANKAAPVVSDTSEDKKAAVKVVRKATDTVRADNSAGEQVSQKVTEDAKEAAEKASNLQDFAQLLQSTGGVIKDQPQVERIATSRQVVAILRGRPVGDDVIGFTDFLAASLPRVFSHWKEGHCRKAFRIFDRNGDGYIDAKELELVLRREGEETHIEAFSSMLHEAADSKQVPLDRPNLRKDPRSTRPGTEVLCGFLWTLGRNSCGDGQTCGA